MKTRDVALVAGICVALVGGVLVFRGAGDSGAERDRARAAVSAAVTEGPRITVLEGDAPTPSSAPSPEAVADVHSREFREKARLAEARRRAARKAIEEADTTAALAAEQELLALETSLQDSLASLTQQLISHPELTTNVVALLREETDPMNMLLIAQALGEAAAVLGDQFPYDLLLDMAHGDGNFSRREAALVALGYVSHIPPDLEQKVLEISRTAPTVALQTAAIHSIGSWMSRNPNMADRLSESLLETRTASDETLVRATVIQTIGNMDRPLTPKVLQAMSEAVVEEPDPWSRSLAAVALGSGTSPQNRDAVLAALEHAYLNETKLDTKRHIITQITKASRYDAENYLLRLPTPHPLLEQDVKDYIEILNSMDRNNWGAIWDRKSERDTERGTYPSGHGGHDVDEE